MLRTGLALRRLGPQSCFACVLFSLSFSSTSATPAAANTLISGAEAIKLMKQPSTRCLDCSFYLSDPTNKAATDFSLERIPNSARFDIDSVKDESSSMPHMLPSSAVFSEKVERMGISNDNLVVLYTRFNSFSAPRVWWMFKAFGHDNVRIINGGYEEWKRAGGEIERGDPVPPSRGRFVCELRPGYVMTLEDMKALVAEGGDTQIVDTRPAARFKGLEPEPRAGLGRGHMPGARNAPFATFLDAKDWSKLLPAEEVKASLTSAGIDLSKPAVASCGSGVTACHVALYAHIAGLPTVPIYDGSWAEYGSVESLPKVTSE